MFFWVGLVVVFLVFVCLVSWGARGTADRVHKPGTRHLD